MIKFFRKIRKRLMGENKTGRYIMYALGEIALVVIGILIAVSINNWNEGRKNRLIEQKLLSELKENLQINLSRLDRDLVLEQRTIDAVDLVVNHIDNRKPYHDSLDVYFGYAFYAPDIVLSTSAFESIKSRGFDIIHTDTLRKSILELFDVSYALLISETVRLENQFWPASVLPLTHKHFRKSPNGDTKPVDYNALLNDPVYTNTILDRKGFRMLAIRLKTDAVAQTESTLSLINDALK